MLYGIFVQSRAKVCTPPPILLIVTNVFLSLGLYVQQKQNGPNITSETFHEPRRGNKKNTTTFFK